jgi:hypothetical protein
MRSLNRTALRPKRGCGVRELDVLGHVVRRKYHIGTTRAASHGPYSHRSWCSLWAVPVVVNRLQEVLVTQLTVRQLHPEASCSHQLLTKT